MASMTIPVAEWLFDRMPLYIGGAQFEWTKLPALPVVMGG
jgi:hypothetical protein